ncbi:rubredoxin [Niabella beijingensis]|uniref:rubredoxin n=1 Tax=Niabella beijingensis TaxID=2872700 RepID=UPI001CBCD46A|nr:rubredoxin [Niabella beijingensis]MBZ4191337.1 rubredoxin [Niabella beijingensis]
MSASATIKINFRGGIISPGDLYEILSVAGRAGIGQVRFGLRQQLLISGSKKQITMLADQLSSTGFIYEVDRDDFPNIISSYPAEDIFISQTWLSEGVYKDIFDEMDHVPRLKVNICDSNQSFTPSLTGNINWVAAAASPHFWHLFVRFPKTNIVYEWDELVYTNDIAALSKELEEQILNNGGLFYDQPNASGEALFDRIKKEAYITRKSDHPALLPQFNLPYYEGLHRHNNKYWLGVYRRDELFPILFLKDLCRICLETKVGQLCATPWKTIIVKGIEEKDKHCWTGLLNVHALNMRHAANELNFQVEDNNPAATRLKQYLVKELNDRDTRTFGLCIGIKTRNKSEVFSSILVKRRPVLSVKGKALFYLFDILCAHEYNPNKRTGFVFSRNRPKFLLGRALRVSVLNFYKSNRSNHMLSHPPDVIKEVYEQKEEWVYQCKNCLTVCDVPCSATGDGNVAATVEALPEAFVCPLCESGPSDFTLVSKLALGLQVV